MKVNNLCVKQQVNHIIAGKPFVSFSLESLRSILSIYRSKVKVNLDM